MNGQINMLKQVEPLLEDGDIIFIRISNFLYRRVAETSDSWESHVGLAFHNPGGGWSVAESRVPVATFTPMEQFISRSDKGRFLVKRVREHLTGEEKACLRKAAESMMNKLYHQGFNYDSPRLYCSKFVYDVYKNALGREVGRIQSFRELLSAYPDAPVGFWRVWFFGVIPWARRCVTTTSQINDEKLVTVFDTEQAVKTLE